MGGPCDEKGGLLYLRVALHALRQIERPAEYVPATNWSPSMRHSFSMGVEQSQYYSARSCSYSVFPFTFGSGVATHLNGRHVGASVPQDDTSANGVE